MSDVNVPLTYFSKNDEAETDCVNASVLGQKTRQLRRCPRTNFSWQLQITVQGSSISNVAQGCSVAVFAPNTDKRVPNRFGLN